MRLSLGSRRGFICRMRVGNAQHNALTSSHTIRLREENILGPAEDGHKYAVVHVTGYIKNWSVGESKLTIFNISTHTAAYATHGGSLHITIY